MTLSAFERCERGREPKTAREREGEREREREDTVSICEVRLPR